MSESSTMIMILNKSPSRQRGRTESSDQDASEGGKTEGGGSGCELECDYTATLALADSPAMWLCAVLSWFSSLRLVEAQRSVAGEVAVPGAGEAGKAHRSEESDAKQDTQKQVGVGESRSDTLLPNVSLHTRLSSCIICRVVVLPD